MALSFNFSSLKEYGFTESYECIEDAMKCDDSDPKDSCRRFRITLERILRDVYNLFGTVHGCNASMDIGLPNRCMCGNFSKNIVYTPNCFFTNHMLLHMESIIPLALNQYFWQEDFLCPTHLC